LTSQSQYGYLVKGPFRKVNDLFTAEEKQALLGELAKWCDDANHWAHFNQHWDVGFKILLLALAIASAFCAATIASKYKQSAPPSWLSIFNASASTVVVALSAFAFTQFDFAGRQRTYETKRNAFKLIIYELRYFAPKKGDVFDDLQTIHSWCDTNPAPPGWLSKTHR
jgi:hypothetical protein